MASLLVLAGLCAFLCLSSSLFVTPALSIPLDVMIATREGMEESDAFMRRSTVLSDIDGDEYGSELTIILPTNEAWRTLSDERREHLLNPTNADDLETLLLFSTTDLALRKADVEDGMSLITLLGVETQVDKSNNRLCIQSYDPTAVAQCANIVEWDIEVDEGVVHVVDKLLMPEELSELFYERGI